VLLRCCGEGTTLITGAPLKNLGSAMRLGGEQFQLGRLVAQGGFAGVGVVPPEQQLDKFKGRTTCPTFNLNGDPKSALTALSHPGIAERRFVSKNVCHGVVYDQALHRRFAAIKGRSRSLDLIWKGMDAYLDPRGEPGDGKKFHDPLAACCAIDQAIGTWAEVELYREKGEWGSRLCPGSKTWIITGYDHERFVRTLMAYTDG
jgi:pyrimidine-specific ribonucleoside hydrolase